MEENYEKISCNLLKHLDEVNQALEMSKINSKVLTNEFGKKIELLHNAMKPSSQKQHSPALDVSLEANSVEEMMQLMAKIKEMPKEFGPSEKPTKKPITAKSSVPGGVSKVRKNVHKVNSVSDLRETKQLSRNNSALDLAETAQKKVDVEELIQRINQNKNILSQINQKAIEYPDCKNFGIEIKNLVKEFKQSLSDIKELYSNFEMEVQKLEGTEGEEDKTVIDSELNELLEQFTKIIQDYNYLQKNKNSAVADGLRERELDFPYSSILEEIRFFIQANMN